MAYRTTPRMAERKEVQRNHLLETAVRLFGEHGYHDTTVPMIVKASKRSTGSFYFYFRNKEDVFAAAIERFGQLMDAALIKAITEADNETTQRLQAATVEAFVFLAENNNESRILIAETSGMGFRLERARRDLIESHARIIEKALQEAVPRVVESC
jgi:AcrR family transcriptional regulator